MFSLILSDANDPQGSLRTKQTNKQTIDCRNRKPKTADFRSYSIIGPSLPDTTKQIAPTYFKQKVIMLKKFCVLFYKQAIPDRMEFF